MDEHDPIGEVSQSEASEGLRRSSVTYLECTISLMTSHMDVDMVAGILEEDARQLREFG